MGTQRTVGSTALADLNGSGRFCSSGRVRGSGRGPIASKKASAGSLESPRTGEFRPRRFRLAAARSGSRKFGLAQASSGTRGFRLAP